MALTWTDSEFFNTPITSNSPNPFDTPPKISRPLSERYTTRRLSRKCPLPKRQFIRKLSRKSSLPVKTSVPHSDIEHTTHHLQKLDIQHIIEDSEKSLPHSPKSTVLQEDVESKKDEKT